MKRKPFSRLWLCMALPFLCGCHDSGVGDFAGNRALQLTTVEIQPDNHSPYFVTDNGLKLWVTEALVPYNALQAGERTMINFTYLKYGTDGFDYFIRLNGFSVVPLQNIVNLTPANRDSLGNNPVEIEKMWTGASYLNLNFYLNRSEADPPIISLAVNRIDPPIEDGYAHLQLCYNNHGHTGELVSGIVSFNLGRYAPDDSPYLGLKVRVNSVNRGDTVYVFPYPASKMDN